MNIECFWLMATSDKLQLSCHVPCPPNPSQFKQRVFPKTCALRPCSLHTAVFRDGDWRGGWIMRVLTTDGFIAQWASRRWTQLRKITAAMPSKRTPRSHPSCPLFVLSLCFLAAVRLAAFSCHAFLPRCFCSCTGLKTTKPSKHGQKPWAYGNPSSQSSLHRVFCLKSITLTNMASLQQTHTHTIHVRFQGKGQYFSWICFLLNQNSHSLF